MVLITSVQTVKLPYTINIMSLIIPEIVVTMKENNNLNMQTAFSKNAKCLTIRQLLFLAQYLRKTTNFQNKSINMKFENVHLFTQKNKMYIRFLKFEFCSISDSQFFVLKTSILMVDPWNYYSRILIFVNNPFNMLFFLFRVLGQKSEIK